MGNSSGSELQPDVELTSYEKKLLARTWHSHIKHHQHLGVMAFDSMFNEAPETRDAFGHFADIDVHHEQYNEILHRHGDRVKQSVEKVIDSIQNKEDVKSYLTTLGCRHYKEYGFVPQYLPVVSQYFLEAIKEVMGKDWNAELERAYTKLFDIIGFYMSGSLAITT